MRKPGRCYWTIYLYLGREMIFSFLVGFLFFFFIFFVNNLLLLIQNENILAKNIPLHEVFLIVIYRLPIVILFAFPFGTLVGGLMAVARLAADNEILALRASGLSSLMMFTPFLVLGVAISLLSYYTNDYLLPASSLEQQKLGRQMFLAHPQLNLEANTVKAIADPRLLIMTGEVDDEYIYDVVIFDRTDQQDRRIIAARRAQVVPNEEQPDVISLRLENVFTQTIDVRKQEHFQYALADYVDYNLIIQPFGVNISLGPMEKTAADILKIIAQKEQELKSQYQARSLQLASQLYEFGQEIMKLVEAEEVSYINLPAERSRLANHYLAYKNLKNQPLSDNELKRYLIEINRKFAFPFSCLVFIFFAYPVGILARRSGRIFGFGIGLLAAAVYWGLLLIGHELGYNQNFSPFLSMWLPNIIVLAVGLTIQLLRHRQ